MLEPNLKTISNVRDPMTGEVYESIRGDVKIGSIVKLGFASHERTDEIPINKTGNVSPIFCRILGRADMARIAQIKARLADSSGLPLLDAPWYRVLYD